MFVDVALPLPIKKYFTYIIPDFLKDKILFGSIVTVPFRNKIIVGVAINFSAKTELAESKLKPVIDLLQPNFPIQKELIDLAKWISEYYCSSLGEALQLILPPGIDKISKRKIKPILKDGVQLSINEKLVYEELVKLKSATISQVENRLKIKSLNIILESLKEKELIYFEEFIKKDLSKIEKWINVAGDLNKLLPTKIAEKRILEYLKSEVVKEISVKELISITKSSSATLKYFTDSGVLNIFDKQINRDIIFDYATPKKNIKLNDEQVSAVEEITKSLINNVKSTFLLHGITGSGKTEVYIEAMKKVISSGGDVIFLVPEILLASQTLSRLKNYFSDNITILHSNLSDGERFSIWNGIKSGKFKIVVGARSAIFAPLNNLKLIIVDEEHESTYKQYDSQPRYNARDVAVFRSVKNNCVTILGSATPAIETYFNALINKYKLLNLTKRNDNAELPTVEIIDLKKEQKLIFENAKEKAKTLGKKVFSELIFSISNDLKIAIENKLSQKEGIIILQNRRGYSPFLICADCGFIPKCKNCDLTLTFHATKKHLRCHICGFTETPPDKCPKCIGINFKYSGFGTQRVEEQLQTLFPAARILRFDLDTTNTKGAHEILLKKFANREADILLGTQMIAKGLDFHHVNLVGVINSDTQLMLPDFRASEKTFQLITQVSGRAGRGSNIGKVLVQSFQPDNYSILCASNHDYLKFYQNEIEFRKATSFPPFVRLALIEFSGRNENFIFKSSELFFSELAKLYKIGILLGPVPATISKIKNNFRFHIIVKIFNDKDPAGQILKNILSKLIDRFTKTNLKIIVDIDPQSLL